MSSLQSLCFELAQSDTSGGGWHGSTATQPLICSFSTPAEWGENRRKARRLLDRDNGSLIGKVKAVCTSITRGGLNPVLPIVHVYPLHEKQSLSVGNASSGGKLPQLWIYVCPLSSSFLHASTVELFEVHTKFLHPSVFSKFTWVLAKRQS